MYDLLMTCDDDREKIEATVGHSASTLLHNAHVLGFLL